MKRTFFIAFSLLLIASFFYSCSQAEKSRPDSAETVEAETATYPEIDFLADGKTNEEILTLLKSENKPGFLYFTTDWCGWCKKLRKDTFSVVKGYVEENFVPFKIDAEKKTGPALKDLYGVSAYPTVVIVNPDGEVMDKVIGYDQPEPYKEKLVTSLSGEGTLLALMQAYTANPEDSGNALKYGSRLLDGYDFAKARPVFEGLEKITTDESQLPQIYFHLGTIYTRERETEKAASYMEKIISRFDGFDKMADVYYSLSSNYFYSQKDQDKGIELLEKGLEKEYFTDTLDRAHYTLANMNFARKTFEQAMDYIKKVPADSRYFSYLQPSMAVCYFKTDKKDEGAAFFEKLFAEAGEPRQVNTIAAACLSNEVYLEKAQSWMEKALEMEGGQEYFIYFTYGRLLDKNGQTAKAIEMMEKAIELSTSDRTSEYYREELDKLRKSQEEK